MGGFSAARQRLREWLYDGADRSTPSRFWIETGFKALKSVSWQWRKTRRTDPARVERHWLALAAATLTLAAGSRVEDAQALKKSPSALRSPPKAAPDAAASWAYFVLVWRR